MALDSRLAGRAEKRLPVMMEVQLALAGTASMERREKADVENISVLGACVYARSPWRQGEQVHITPATGEGPLRGEVIYCHKQADGRFVVGLKFQRSPRLMYLLRKLKEIVH